MNAEHEVEPSRINVIAGKVYDRALFYGVTVAGPVIAQGTENIVKNSSVEYEEGFWGEFEQAVADGYVPIVLADHQTHFDGAAIPYILREMADRTSLKGHQMPLASSLDNGNQGGKMQALFNTQRRTLARNKTEPLILVRSKDQEKYHEKDNLIEAMDKLRDFVAVGYGIFEFPEGETTGGKINTDGTRHGMVEFKKNAIRSLLIAVRHAGKKAMIIPLSTDGGFWILDPNTQLPTRHALRVALGLRKRKGSEVRFHVGLPMKADEGELGELISAKDWDGVNKLVGRKIASHLHPSRRGAYA